ncbi:MAG: hypothetical protein NC201_00880 [Prevotella sp.]|nr:hypothetical protein [Bacteroides sp.]MCM1365780.1 hypothetical protein [Prevotella sp.]MCM1436528.1 hypothetical protein [Prevotella sp.]
MFTPAFAISNVIILPFLPTYIVLEIVYVLASLCGFQIPLTGHILDWGADAVMLLTEWLGGNDSRVIFLQPHWLVAVLWTAATVGLGIYLSQRKNLQKWKEGSGVPKSHKCMPYCIGTFMVFALILLPFGTKADNSVQIEIHRPMFNPYIVMTSPKGIRTPIKYAEGETSRWKVAGKSFVMISCNNYSERSRQPFIPPNVPEKCDYLIVDTRYRGSLSRLLQYFAPNIIVDGRTPTSEFESFASEMNRLNYNVTVHSLYADRHLIIQIYSPE